MVLLTKIEMVAMLKNLRAIVGMPIKVHSAYRSL
jgi:hypothetical protein